MYRLTISGIMKEIEDLDAKYRKDRQVLIDEMEKYDQLRRQALETKPEQLAVAEESTPAPAPEKKKRKLSVAGRKAIVAATKKRWEKIRQEQAAEAEVPAKPKRQMSAKGRKAVAAAQKKRWAEYHRRQK